jgi:hypothetical protein
MPTVFGKTSIMILKKYTAPSKLLIKSFEDFYEQVQKVNRSQPAIKLRKYILMQEIYWLYQN